MIQKEKDINIVQSQCIHACYASKVTKNLSINKCVSAITNNNIIIMSIIKMLKRYTPFISTVYNAQEIVFIKGSCTEYLTIDFALDGNTITYTGLNNIESINNYLVSEINSLNGKYYALLDGDTFYIYTYSNTENYTIIPNITITPDIITSQNLLSFSINSLQYNLDKIVNLWNCITEEEFYKLKDKIIKITC